MKAVAVYSAICSDGQWPCYIYPQDNLQNQEETINSFVKAQIRTEVRFNYNKKERTPAPAPSPAQKVSNLQDKTFQSSHNPLADKKNCIKITKIKTTNKNPMHKTTTPRKSKNTKVQTGPNKTSLA